MSKLITSTIYGPTNTNNVVSVKRDSLLNVQGAIIGFKSVQTDSQTLYSAPASGDGTTITDLSITYTPKLSTSILLMRWMINAETHWDVDFLMHQNGSLITTAGYQGYNNVSGNVRWSSLMSAPYDNDTASTPANWCLQYYIPASNTTSRTYSPAIRGSGATAYTLYLNRTASSTGQDAYETMVSTGTIMEISQ